LAHAVFEHGREGAAIEGREAFLFGEAAQAAGVFGDYAVAHGHLFVEFDTHLKDFAEVFFIVVQHFVQFAIADEQNFYVDDDGLGF